MRKNKVNPSNININNSGSIQISGDIVGRDKIDSHVENFAFSDIETSLNLWERKVTELTKKTKATPNKKRSIKKHISTIKKTILKNKRKKPSQLEKLLNTLSIMSYDIFEVAIATLVDPLAGIGLTLKKVKDKVKIEVNS